MGRPRQFSEERAVDAAMRVFWSQGYEATSTQDLCAATGLGRSSIYNTFRSKHDLFTRSLEHYFAITSATLDEIVASGGSASARLRRLLDITVEEAAGQGRDGCFAVNCTVELGPRDEAVDAMLNRERDRRIDVLGDLVREGQRDGEFPGADPLAVANYLMSVIGGIRISARSGAAGPVLQGIADVAKAAL
ncbi:TetR/AcrR family transcriptional regulator [Phytomonospora endophytica]|uniref:AcrR family transcriptional regulator n=1 Tax=Phytomonospora endophytica TaxID=714109 RepID=A0A841FVW9_9ACTN|nr:TetR/AcrR family transcriptional regulator [Phytomonospora endophytica]MBB6039934.1 AcrR family transcriptional regulator [Phytomonospora endophytica]GIG70996.1 TetR family transcriptional regulator [Phytomonospora endophytica]